MAVTDKKSAKKTSKDAQPEKPKAEAKPAEIKPAAEAPKVLGPGVVKRPKRDPNVPVPQTDGEVTYMPSDQVFRRR